MLITLESVPGTNQYKTMRVKFLAQGNTFDYISQLVDCSVKVTICLTSTYDRKHFSMTFANQYSLTVLIRKINKKLSLLSRVFSTFDMQRSSLT